MKIHEIISENQTEGVDNLVVRGLKAPLKAIGKFFGSDRSQLVKMLANDLAARGKWAGAATPKEAYKLAKDAGPIAHRLVKSDPQILADAAREANKVRAPSLWNKITGASKGSSAVNAAGKSGLAGKAWQAGVYGLQAWGLYEMWAPPLQDYYESMDIAKANLDSGAWNKENYHNEENKQLSALIGRLGAALLITSVPALLINNKLTRAILGKYLGGILAMGTAGGVLYFRKWLNREDNADKIAAIMMNDYIAGNGEIMGNPIPGLGSIAAKAKQAIMGDVEADPSKAKPDRSDSSDSQAPAGGQNTSPAGTTTGNTNGKQDIASTSIAPADKGSTATPGTGKTAMGRKMWSDDPLAINNYDITGWVSKPGKPGFIQDPKNPANFLPKPDGWTP
jgi:hypothetical protein